MEVDEEEQVTDHKPRLRWTPELHHMFLKAVHQLGGANKATPKTILNLMNVEGISLHHLKSHLQKFRLGKIGKRMWKREEILPVEYYAAFPITIPQAAHHSHGSSLSNSSDGNGSWCEYLANTLAAEAYGHLDFQVAVTEPDLTSSSNVEMDSSSQKVEFCVDEDIGDDKEPLLDSTYPNWCDGIGSQQPVFPMRFDNELMDDYLNSLSYHPFQFEPQLRADSGTGIAGVKR